MLCFVFFCFLFGLLTYVVFLVVTYYNNIVIDHHCYCYCFYYAYLFIHVFCIFIHLVFIHEFIHLSLLLLLFCFYFYCYFDLNFPLSLVGLFEWITRPSIFGRWCS